LADLATVRGLARPGSPPRSPVTLTWLAASIGAVVTALVVFDVVAWEYRNTAAHLVLETVDACIALLVSYLVYGRFLRSRRLQDFLLLQGLLLLAVAGFGTTVALLALGEDRGGRLDVWLPMAVRVAGALFVTAAAVRGTHRLLRPVWVRWSWAPAGGVLAASIIVLGAFAAHLPVALNPSTSPDTSLHLALGHPLLAGAQAFTMLCFAASAYLFTAQALRGNDELIRWLGPACALGAFARLNFVLFPSLYSQWLYMGDVLRTAFYLLLLVGGAREIHAYWAAQARAAVVEDRRRLARELHDGVVQELGYIRSESSSLRSTDDPGRTERILSACDRALDEARQAVEAMGSSADGEPLGFTVHRAARQVADRFGVALELELDDTVTAEQGQRHALLRIVREAVANAARHGGASKVSIELVRDSIGRRLVVCDDGGGFDVEQALMKRTGFGLTSMRERADGLPGRLLLESNPGSGTKVVVTW
jgi:signal transduction histidine kinase